MISLRKLLPICAMPNGGFTRIEDVTFLKLTKMPCAVSGRRYGDARLVAQRADMRLEHQVERPRLREVAFGVLAGPLGGPLPARGGLELVGAEAELARPAVDEGIREALDVAGGHPDLRVEDDRRVQSDDVVALLDHRSPPFALDVVVQEDAVMAEVERRAEPAVDVGGRVDETAATAERRDLLDRRRTFELLELFRGHGWKLASRRALRRSTRAPRRVPSPRARATRSCSSAGTSTCRSACGSRR